MNKQVCAKCGRDLDQSGHLIRVNPVGELPAVWECRPECGKQSPFEENLLAAIEGDPKHE